MKQHFITKTAISTNDNHDDIKQTNFEIQLAQVISAAQKSSSNTNVTKIIPSIPISTSSQTTSWIKSGTRDRSKIIRKSYIAIIAICFGIYGVVLFFLVFNHFDQSVAYCSSIIDELANIDRLYLNFTIQQNNGMFLNEDKQKILDAHPELFVYNYCLYQVYPFGSDMDENPLCDCRVFNSAPMQYESLCTNQILTVSDLHNYFNLDFIDMLSGILLNWHMLEKFAWAVTMKIHVYSNKNGISYKPRYFNLTNDMFGAPSPYIGKGISN